MIQGDAGGLALPVLSVRDPEFRCLGKRAVSTPVGMRTLDVAAFRKLISTHTNQGGCGGEVLHCLLKHVLKIAL